MITTLLVLICCLLLVVSLTMFWYVRKLISSINEIYNVLQDTLVSIEDYEEHLEKVYSMDTFYGDNTLQGLLDHSRDLKKGLEEIVNIIRSFFNADPEEEGTNAEEA